jgi:hypothetical protein
MIPFRVGRVESGTRRVGYKLHAKPGRDVKALVIQCLEARCLKAQQCFLLLNAASTGNRRRNIVQRKKSARC